jgi:sugar phosphate isomerase/epimerase
VRLGGPIFIKSDDPRELAREHRRLGYSAAYCPDAKTSDTEKIRAIRDGFDAENVVIAEVGAWKNMLDPDAAARKANLDYVTERLALADAVGARCCVDIAGSYNPTIWYGMDPKNLSKQFFDATVENCRHVIDAIRPTRTRFTIEMMPWALPDGPDSYLSLIKAVDRPAFAVHLDVCNVINSPERFYNNKAVIEDCFRKLARWIVSCHAKDLAWIPEYNVHFAEVIPGRGVVDYGAYLHELSMLAVDAPLMLEHLKNSVEYDEGRAYIQKVAAQTGISFA